MQRTRSLALPLTRRAGVRAFSTSGSAQALRRWPRSRPLPTGPRGRHPPQPIAPRPQPLEAMPPLLGRASLMALASVTISGCASAAWSIQQHRRYTPSYRPTSRAMAAKAALSGVVTGLFVAAASPALMPTALALGPCLGVAFLAMPMAGIVQVGIGVARAEDAAPKSSGHTWLARTILM
ncbi:hypothetical protein pqer_cds_646 [Pandoravirus quercus]|uniref:Uncharacterized protein n=1 Tax=Pandoravirus quercus TaxID=2107709 RepID=A0A2U7U9E4_9VIRU|nr:hypothetical protein pqer_cds_646 [Pandoravirus quercus]AVK75068.1 hypothetical protein pqer_cds_646 [Pandoravirus quercus]